MNTSKIKKVEHSQKQPLKNHQLVKDKKKLRNTKYQFEIDPKLAKNKISGYHKKLNNKEEQRKIDEEKLSQEELRRKEETIKFTELKKLQQENIQPKPYSKQQLEYMFKNMNDFQCFEKDNNGIKIKERKHLDYKKLKRYEKKKRNLNPNLKEGKITEVHLDRPPIYQNEPNPKLLLRVPISIQEQL
ncbi:unnamed protein product [Paramecium primaurelia]|uniref:Uncharacterized protein n=1 Tax=Paramecium primaurelia TaxID=5886 RepID=A0A8S1MT41_PARPR|nr:unnamed protein product [Paramecium primaurelia]